MPSAKYPKESDSPHQFAAISKAFLRGFDILWQSEFDDKDPFFWDNELLLHPISHLLGLSLETAAKGLLVSRGKKPDRTHNLTVLMAEVVDEPLGAEISARLTQFPTPEALFEANASMARTEVEAQYHAYKFHVGVLDSWYDRPYASRYPAEGLFSRPCPLAIREIVSVIQERLEQEKHQWQPKA